jgi:hypothetical protein
MFARPPERVAAEQRRASIPFPCAEESKAADAQIAELVKKGEALPDAGYSWKCTVGDSKPWFIKLENKNGAEVLAIREVIGSKAEQWSGAADANELILQATVPVTDENGTAVDSKSILRLKRNGRTLEGTMDRPGGWFPQVDANSWTCKPSKVVCTR